MGCRSLAFLVSGNGTNLQAVMDAIEAGELHGSIAVVISDRPEAHALRRAYAGGIPTAVIERGHEPIEEYTAAVVRELKKYDPDLIVMAGFMRILGREFVSEFPKKIINTHPALLPCFGGRGFYGAMVHRAVISSGARFSGCTVHFVTEAVDAGPIIMQRIVPVEDGDTPETLADRLRPVENRTLVDAVKLVCSGAYSIRGNRVVRGQEGHQ